jgi:pimeloyl-ACP methyl ester carboxylesterase
MMINQADVLAGGVRKAYVDTRFGQIHYRSLAADNSEAPLVFFHRTPVTSASFVPVMHELAGWRPMIAFDTPGFGASFTPEPAAAMPDFVAFFTAALDALEVATFHLVGHHTGAHFAAELALHLPDRALSLMIDGAMVTTAEEREAQRPAPPVTVDEQGIYARHAWNFLRPYYTCFDEQCIHAEFVGALSSTFTRSACMAAVQSHDLGAVLSRVAIPVLASAAADDVFVHHLERIAAALPGTAVRTYENAGIASPELRAATFAGLVRASAGGGRESKT